MHECSEKNKKGQEQCPVTVPPPRPPLMGLFLFEGFKCLKLR